CASDGAIASGLGLDYW
nr:immunoglobulin heavy chain junction region [Macaca mulatta]MOW78525.1 immunoglobulin heavy chain junction region [Macaca mulatta]MOW82809.1 immunoglobulin heavy chain junction region [Macaca mulatta]MOW84321.1 immunoglobulin heavy chain junction region [Macaca mulatta]MOW85584.1 immunoglobulin heavy chain junction region [Macaca mulatta]